MNCSVGTWAYVPTVTMSTSATMCEVYACDRRMSSFFPNGREHPHGRCRPLLLPAGPAANAVQLLRRCPGDHRGRRSRRQAGALMAVAAGGRPSQRELAAARARRTCRHGPRRSVRAPRPRPAGRPRRRPHEPAGDHRRRPRGVESVEPARLRSTRRSHACWATTARASPSRLERLAAFAPPPG